MEAQWIVSANASRARFFALSNRSGPLQEVEDMANPAVRLRTSETEPDRLGPTAATKSRHNVGAATPNKSYQPAQTPAQHQTEVFAQNVAAFLLKNRQAGQFQGLVLIASPEFLGVLRKQLSSELESAVRLEINKDYTQYTPAELLEQLKALRDKG